VNAMRIFGCLIVTLLSGLFIARPASALAEELVKFNTAIGQGGKIATGVQGYMTRPNGAGPFPVVVLLHSCLGLPADRRAIGDMFASWGYVALFVDDFTTRRIKETCSRDFGEAAADAYGALIAVGRLPYVDRQRIAAIGYSQGGDTALKIASGGFDHAFAIPGNLKFKAAAAFYPPCENEANARLRMPTLILVGGSDEVTPASDCARLEKAQAGDVAKLIVYPGAFHVFDMPEFAGGKRLFGMMLKYDREATAQSRVALRDFLAARLAR
jgi:dienelactone hydrolase